MNPESTPHFPEEPNEPEKVPEIEWSDPLGLFTENPTPEQLAALHKLSEHVAKLDNVDLKSEIWEKVTVGEKVSFERFFELVNSELANMNLPSVDAPEDIFLEEFRDAMQYSAGLSEDIGALFDLLASGGLRRPTKKYFHIARDSALPGMAESFIETARRSAASLLDAPARIATMSAALAERFEELPPRRHEERGDSYTFQSFAQNIEQDGGTNTIQEMVINVVYDAPSHNRAEADLIVQKRGSDKCLELKQFIPEGAYFSPAEMLEVERDLSLGDEEDTADKIIIVPKSLADYRGTQLAQPASEKNSGFSASSEGRIAYQNLKEKGGMLRLLHEIAHAWQFKYHEVSGKAQFEDFYKKVARELSMASTFQQMVREGDPRFPVPPLEDGETVDDFIVGIASMARERLRGLGVDIDPADYQYAGQPLGNGKYKLSKHSMRLTEEGGIGIAKEEFVIASDRVGTLIKDFVWEERQAWADAIRVLRYLRKYGFDLEPELKTHDDIQGIVHYALGTYQAGIEAKFEPTKDIKKFTNKSRFKGAE